MVHKYDIVIVGAGGAGLRAAIETPPGATCAVITKVFPSRSHTGTAQGGVCAALANEEEDSWEWHMFDTVKGGDYLGDQDAIEIMCQDAIRAIIELEHMGLPFSRTHDGKIAQRRFGGHTRDFGKAPVKRACYSADRTGHVMLQTLFENCIRNRVNFFPEYLVTDIIIDKKGICCGVVVYDIATGEIHTFHARAVMFATGGYGRAYRITSNAMISTGDGFDIMYERGIPLEDMEFVQFHPTGLWKLGILVSEAARGEGGILLNNRGERFMERYAPTVKDLAPRDMISRAIMTEIREGRGFQGTDGTYYINLDVSHLGKKIIDEKLPEITGFARTYLGIEPTREPIPVQPTTHYAMGGIPTDIDGHVLIDAKGNIMPGLYSAGECACVSVHGANRLGTNSLLDIVVFGRRGGKAITEYLKTAEFVPLPKNVEEKSRDHISTILCNVGKESVVTLRTELQETMMENVGIFRTKAGIKKALKKIEEIKSRYKHTTIEDKGKTFNTDLVEAIELKHLIGTSEAIAVSALNREESRGAHACEDFPKRDDKKWLKHTFLTLKDGKTRITYKPVTITRFQPQERKY